MRLLGFSGLLVLLAVAVLGPGLSEGRTVSGRELKVLLHQKLHLPHKLLRYKQRIINVVVCEVHRRTRLQTNAVTVFGTRKTTTAKPTTTTTTTLPPTTITTTTSPPPNSTTTTSPRPTSTTTTSPPPTSTIMTSPRPTSTTRTTTAPTTPPADSPAEVTDLDTAGSDSVEIGSRRRRSLAETDDEGSGMPMTTAGRRNQDGDDVGEGSGSSMTMEDELNEEEDKFDEEQMMRDDNTLETSSSEEDESGVCNVQSNNWSLGYYGIFTLPDSHFCCSGYRWSRNVCQTDCRAFTDDDISDDVDCVVKSGFWRFLLRTASRWCWFHHGRFSGRQL
ncbi:location of vulva defective 1-like [Salarias fasciatus]|uniref:location of vulva defective 1-like n=1 Tax=Salarias fasciatus TaxID=181472 RepID=UPI00117689A9|nr:location of vulva defective 1-like [Salarias fasciatus]